MCKHFRLSFCGLSTGTMLRVFSRNISMERIPSKTPTSQHQLMKAWGRVVIIPHHKNISHLTSRTCPGFPFKSAHLQNTPYDSIWCTNPQKHTQCIEDTQAIGAEAQQSCPPAEGALSLIQATLTGLQITHSLSNKKHTRLRVRSHS